MGGRLIICRGLPGSGKSTYAKDLVVMGKGQVVRVNKDDIRAEDGKPWSHDVEKQTIKTRDFRIAQGLSAGKTVISDDTNFSPVHEARLRELARKYKAEFILNESFLLVPLEECIARDKVRESYAQVGEKVITDMWAKYMKGKELPVPQGQVEYVEGLPRAIICDLDGTLCLHHGRSPFDYDKCDTDIPNHPVREILWLYHDKGINVVYLSGREDSCREKTSAWLESNHCPPGRLFMRASKDFRKDSIIKREIFDREIRGKFNVAVCLDDRDQVVKLWRDMGLTCFQVAYGSF